MITRAYIPVFVASDGSRFEYDVADSLVPSSLKPGQSAVVMIAFATNQIDGQFSLRENTQLQQVIVSTTLRHP